jgi:hypothetical protein
VAWSRRSWARQNRHEESDTFQDFAAGPAAAGFAVGWNVVAVAAAAAAAGVGGIDIHWKAADTKEPANKTVPLDYANHCRMLLELDGLLMTFPQ